MRGILRCLQITYKIVLKHDKCSQVLKCSVACRKCDPVNHNTSQRTSAQNVRKQHLLAIWCIVSFVNNST